MNKKKVKLSMKTEILTITLLPLFVLTTVLAIFSINAMRTSLQEEALDGLKDVCYSIEAAYSAVDEGDYALEGENLKKGEFDITENEEIIDSFVKESDIEITLFYGDTRRATSLVDSSTGEKILGTKASSEVVDMVIKQKNEYSSSNLNINNQNYYAYYIPLRNSDGSAVGMVFAGKPTENIDSIIQTKVISILLIALVLFVLAGAVVLIIASRIGKAVRKAETMLDMLSQGNLTAEVDPKLLKRKDELGIMCQSLKGLMEKLKGILGDVKQSSDVLAVSNNDLNEFASHTSDAVNDVSHAVDDISQGAVSQAEDIENATLQVNDMGTAIEKIVAKVETLNQKSEEMELAKSDAEYIITELSESSERTYEAVTKIERQVNLTDESVTKIQDAVALISSIAEETNLLSLNASIEAARAGDAGKGFAVVATQIQKLAEESNSSAASIVEIIDNLARESQDTVKAMRSMQQIIDEQQKKLQETKDRFQAVSEGIQSSRNEIKEIRDDSELCDNARVKVTDVIQNLSAVSEENAAATQETTASMQELNSTMSVLATKADELGTLAKDLEEDMRFFQL